MSTQTKSRILLSVLIAAGMAPAFYLFSVQSYVPYGLFLVLLGLVILAWIWKPWRWLSQKRKKGVDTKAG